MDTKEYRLTDVCDFQGGTQPPKEEWITETRVGYVRMLQIRDFTQDKAEHVGYVKDTKKLNKCEEDDILIGRYGASVGKILTGLTGAYNVAIIKTIPNEELLSKRYLYYVLTGTEFQNFILNIGARAAQAGFNKGDLSIFKLHIPTSLEDQERIATLLEKAQNLIKQREQSINLLDVFLKMKFLELFGDPYSNPKQFKLEKLKTYYLNKKNGTKCGPFGSALKKADYSNSGIPVWNMDNITKDGEFIDSANLWIDENKYLALKSYSVNNNDIIISRAGTVGKMCVVQSKFSKSIISTNLIRLRLGKLLSPIYFIMLMNNFKERIGRLQTGADGAFTHMNTSVLDNLEFPYPPIELQKKFVKYYEHIQNTKKIFFESRNSLISLSNSLCKKALKGELEIIEKVIIEGTIKVEPRISGEVIPIEKINKELEDFHTNQLHTGAPDVIDNKIRQLEAELKIRGEIPFWDEYVKYRIVKGKFKEPFTFNQLWQEISDFPFEILPSYDRMNDLLFEWLKGENPYIRQQYNENTKQIELIVNETTPA